ncbi:MAG TPA: response regulator transcription factor [Solirubrobacteraceae bacterium]|nr:response regulator transcription factor [Solirubrobacteraceae bacterium]
MPPADAAGPPARVLLVDDHAIVRRGLRSILELEPDISVVAEAGGREEALRAIDRVKPDVILLDLKLSADHDAEGLELCSEILDRRPESRVVILSTFLDENLLNQSLRRGAKAYVLKEVDVVELVRIIRAVSRGESGFDSRSAALVRELVAHDDEATEPPLTQREREVIALLARGMTNREIGDTMFVSESTAKFHVRNVMRKLGVRRRAEVAYAVGRQGLPEPGGAAGARLRAVGRG